MASSNIPFYRNGTLLSVSLLGLVVLVMLPPFVSDSMGHLIMAAFDPVCHQIFSRSPHIHDTAFAVCHRCFGAYVGLFAGSLFYLLSRGSLLAERRPLWIMIAAVAPGVVDWSGDIINIWTNTPASRIATGAWFGILAGIILASAILERVRPQ